MPLDTNDLQSITTIIEKYTNRIQMDINNLMPRSEYEKRHEDIRERTEKNTQSIQEVVKWAMAEHERLVSRMEVGFDKLDTQVRDANKQLDDVRSLLSSNVLQDTQRRDSEKNATIRYIISVIIALAIGVLIPVLLRFLGA